MDAPLACPVHTCPLRTGASLVINERNEPRRLTANRDKCPADKRRYKKRTSCERFTHSARPGAGSTWCVTPRLPLLRSLRRLRHPHPPTPQAPKAHRFTRTMAPELASRRPL